MYDTARGMSSCIRVSGLWGMDSSRVVSCGEPPLPVEHSSRSSSAPATSFTMIWGLADMGDDHLSLLRPVGTLAAPP